MKLLVSDANIFIDLEAGDLTEVFFGLPWNICTPDVLYADELAGQHPHLLDHGLVLGVLQAPAMLAVQALQARHSAISRYDCMALALAQQEACPLLTGDRNLRRAAKAEKTEVRGTLWVVEALLQQAGITRRQARQAYEHMQAAGRRLPFADAYRRLDAWKK